jgi:hypothetical protein
MHRPVLALLLAWIALLVGLRVLHYGGVPIRREAAATASLATRLLAQGWDPISAQRLITDGSLTARRFGRGDCVLALVVLPPDPALLAVVQSAWGPGVAFLAAGQLRVEPPPQAGRAARLGQELRHWLGGPPPPSPFSIAVAAEGGQQGCLAGLDLGQVLD